MDKVNKNTIRTYVARLTDQGVSSDRIVRKLQNIRQFIVWAYQNDKIEYLNYQQTIDSIAEYTRNYAKENPKLPQKERHS